MVHLNVVYIIRLLLFSVENIIVFEYNLCEDISNDCWEDEQLMLCGIIARAESSAVHHRGLSAVGECRLHGEGWLVGLTSAWLFCHQKHTFLRTN